ncbi:MAG: type II toxin-antitoxin system PemK/MazF family toxin [Gammaproteobacteria bacterium]
MKRGEIWTVAGGPGYTGKPRPAVIVQDDAFDATASVTVCPFTTNPVEAPLFRVDIQPGSGNGLRAPCRLMVDKLTTVPRARLSERIGRLDDADLVRLNQSAMVFLGLAVSPRARRR